MSQLWHADADANNLMDDNNRGGAKYADGQGFEMTARRDLKGLEILLAFDRHSDKVKGEKHTYYVGPRCPQTSRSGMHFEMLSGVCLARLSASYCRYQDGDL